LGLFDIAVMQVLLVEDHSDSRALLAMLLDRCGCHTVTAKNFAAACACLDDMRFDVLIADLGLPDGDGLELVRYAKERQPLRAIALTGRDSQQDVKLGLQAGFDFYLTKPVDLHEIRMAIGIPAH
jgi:DNA-binding response OmpR family regulator